MKVQEASGVFCSPPLGNPRVGEGPEPLGGVVLPPHCFGFPGDEGHHLVPATVPPPCVGLPGDELPVAPR